MITGEWTDPSEDGILDLDTGEVVSETVWDALISNLLFLGGADGRSGSVFSGCSVYKAAAQSIPNTTVTTLTFDSEEYDTDDFHSTVTNPTRLTIPADGKYEISVNTNFYSSDAGQRNVYIKKNGSNISGASEQCMAIAGGSYTNFTLSTRPIECSAGDYIEVSVYQSSGGALNCAAYLSIKKVG